MDNWFFYLSKLIWFLIAPESILIIVIGVGALLVLIGRYKFGKLALIVGFITMLLIGLFPIGEWLIYPLEKEYPHNPKLKNIDGIILLGGSEQAVIANSWLQPQVNESSDRIFAFIELIKKFPHSTAVYTGGSGSIIAQEFKEADITKMLLNNLEVDTSSIIFERQSRNTWESVKNIKDLVNPRLDQKWVLITSAFHLPRSVRVFCKANWQVIPYPVDFRSQPNNQFRINWNFAINLKLLNLSVREWIGLFAYRLSGKAC